jgi:hypothetical protein
VVGDFEEIKFKYTNTCTKKKSLEFDSFEGLDFSINSKKSMQVLLYDLFSFV